MRITRDNVEELAALLVDVEDLTSRVKDACEQWVESADEPGEDARETRRDARAEIEDNIGGLEDALYNALAQINPKLVVQKEVKP